MGFILNVYTENTLQQSYPLFQKNVFIGRAKNCSIPLQEIKASRYHLRIFWSAGTYWVEDLKSANGTQLNQKTLLHTQPLQISDQLQIGNTQIHLTQHKCIPNIPIEIFKNFPIERYILLETLGQGGMGIVERVWDLWSQREVALKRIRTTDRKTLSQQQLFLLWRLKREAAMTSSLAHPQIVPIYDLRQDTDNQWYFTMPKVEGSTLSSLLKKHKMSPFLEEESFLALLLKVCSAVAYAHAKNIIHRDLKPENIMVGKFGEVYLMDWGIAKQEMEPKDATLTPTMLNIPTESNYQTIGGIGTPGYMAPEQIENAHTVGPPADIYALSKILRQYYLALDPHEELKALMEHYEHSSHKKNKKQVFFLEEKIPSEMRAILEKASHEDWEKRYSSIPLLQQDIEAYLKNAKVSSKDYHLTELLQKWGKRHQRKFMLATFLALVLISFSGLLYWNYQQQTNQQADVFWQESKALQEQCLQNKLSSLSYLWSALHKINQALRLKKNNPLYQTEKSLVGKKLFLQALKEQNYPVAKYALQQLKTLPHSFDSENLLLQQKLDEHFSSLQKYHETLLSDWSTQLSNHSLPPEKILQAISELRKIEDILLIEKIKQEVEQGSETLLKDQNPSPLFVQSTLTFSKVLRYLHFPTKNTFILERVKKFAEISPLTQNSKSVALEQMILLVYALEIETLSKETLFDLQKIRYQMGKHSIFWDRTASFFQKSNLLSWDSPPQDILQPKNDQNPFALYLQAQNLISLQKEFEALENYNESLRLNPYFAEAYYHRGLLFLKQEQASKALEDFQEAIRLRPGETPFYLARASTQEFLNDLPSAIEDYQEVLHLKKIQFMQQLENLPQKTSSTFSEKDYLSRSDALIFVALSRIYQKLGDKKLAQEFLEKANILAPEEAEVFYQQGVFFAENKQWNEAFDAFQKAIQYRPELANAYLKRGQLYEQEEKFSEAEKDYQYALRYEPRNLESYFLIAHLYEKQNHFDLALKTYENALQQHPNSFKAYLKRGQLRAQQKDFQGALADYEHALQLNPTFAEIYHSRGKLALQKKDFLSAQQDFQKVEQLASPPSLELRSDRAKLFWLTENKKAFYQEMEMLLNTYPEESPGYYWKGKYLESQGEYQEALLAYQKAFTQKPDAENCFAIATLMEDFQKREEAFSFIEKAISFEPNRAEFYFFRGKLLQQEQKWQEALVDLNKSIQLDPAFTKAYVIRGSLKNELGQRENAIEDYEKAIQLDTGNEEALAQLLQLKYNASNDPEQAFLFYEKVLQEHPEWTFIYLLRGHLKKQKKLYAEALADYTLALQQNPEQGEPYYFRGLLLWEQGKVKESVENLKLALQYKPKWAPPYFLIAKIMQQKQEWQEAQEHFQQAINFGLKNNETYAGLGESLTHQKKYEPAKKAFNTAIQYTPAQAIYYEQRGIIFFELSQQEEAKQDFLHVLALLPKQAESYHYLGRIAFQQKKYDDAKHYFESAIQYGKLAESYFYAGLLKKELAQTEADIKTSLQYFFSAVEQKPEWAEAHCELGILYYCDGKFDKALIALNKAIQLDKEFSLAYFYRALLSKVEGKKKLSLVLKNYEQAIRFFPEVPSLLFPEKSLQSLSTEKLKKLYQEIATVLVEQEEAFAEDPLLIEKNLIPNSLRKIFEELKLEVPENTLAVTLYAKQAQLLALTKLKKQKKALWHFEVFFYLYPAWQKFRNPYHLPKLQLSAFTYLGTTFYSCQNQTFRIHEYLHKPTEIELMLVPDGVFWMGTTDQEMNELLKKHPYNRETKKHLVYIPSFLIAKTELSQKSWEKIMPPVSDFFEGDKEVQQGDNYPMVRIRWREAKDFCKKSQFELPSESQWEYACRAGSLTSYFWGNENDRQYSYCSDDQVKPPKLYFPYEVNKGLPNAFGLHNTSGNVYEWCEDVFHDSYTESKPKDGTAWKEGEYPYVYRGGCFNSSSYQCRSSFRTIDKKGSSKEDPHRAVVIGFRVCKTLYVY